MSDKKLYVDKTFYAVEGINFDGVDLMNTTINRAAVFSTEAEAVKDLAGWNRATRVVPVRIVPVEQETECNFIAGDVPLESQLREARRCLENQKETIIVLQKQIRELQESAKVVGAYRLAAEDYKKIAGEFGMALRALYDAVDKGVADTQSGAGGYWHSIAMGVDVKANRPQRDTPLYMIQSSKDLWPRLKAAIEQAKQVLEIENDYVR